jgi:hypothetical protein
MTLAKRGTYPVPPTSEKPLSFDAACKRARAAKARMSAEAAPVVGTTGKASAEARTIPLPGVPMESGAAFTASLLPCRCALKRGSQALRGPHHDAGCPQFLVDHGPRKRAPRSTTSVGARLVSDMRAAPPPARVRAAFPVAPEKPRDTYQRKGKVFSLRLTDDDRKAIEWLQNEVREDFRRDQASRGIYTSAGLGPFLVWCAREVGRLRQGNRTAVAPKAGK